MASLQTEDTLPGGLRFLTLQHAHQVAKSRAAAAAAVSASLKIASQAGFAAAATENEGDEKDEDEDEDSGLKPIHDGYQKLYSYFPPRLDGGKQSITATQTIYASGATDKQGQLGPKETTKSFLVQAPQFSLPEGCVLSVNPAPGGLAPAETLPHVVFKDPHLPWERRIEEGDAARRERMPWLALLVFSQDELQLSDEVLGGSNSPFAVTSLAKDADGKPATIKQSPEFALNLSGPDIAALNGQGSIISPIPQPDDAASKTAAVFLKPKLFQQLITTYEQKKEPIEDGKQLVWPSPKEGQAAADISRFKYFAHVRHVKTAGMTASAQYKEGLFSVIMSHRAGPLEADQKVPAVVHLVSLEGWKDMAFPLPPTAQRVAVSSLYSWTYTALPTGGTSLKAEFTNLDKDIGLLRAPDALLAKMEASKDAKLVAKLAKRVREGYTMQRHWTRTGEETSCYFRAALVPVMPAEPTWTAMSQCGSDLQILDRDTGMMDITYSAAWQLGKSLALADAAFTTALTRLWNGLYGMCLDGAKRDKLNEENAFKSRTEVLQSLKTSMMTLSKIQRLSTEDRQGKDAQPRGMPAARRPLKKQVIALAVDDAAILEKSEERAKRYIRRLAGAKNDDGKEYSDGPDGQRFYNELNACVSTEWKMILGWIMDRMHLFGVPPPYLLADPSFLPQESIRFFHIDANWLDALIDGALSLGSHMDKKDSYIRRRIKGAINTYLQTTDPATGFRPQIPTYGMLLRSVLVSRFPDLKIEAPIPENAPEAGRAAILRQEMIGDGLLLCLFDRVPGKDDEMPVLAITQPPHQQTFALCNTLTPDSLKTKYRRTYTVTRDEYDFPGKLPERTLPERTTERRHEASGSSGEAGPPIFLWGDQGDARFLLVDVWAQDVLDVLRNKMPDDFTDGIMTSAVAAFQLGEPIYRFCIGKTSSLKSLEPDPSRPPRAKAFQLLDPMRSSDSQEAARVVTSSLVMLQHPVAPAAPAFPLIAATSLGSGPSPHFHYAPPLLHMSSLAPSLAEMAQAVTMPGNEGATGVKFAYRVHAIEAPNSPLLTGRGPLDLIFTIRRSDDDLLFKDYWLKSIKLAVPRGEKRYSPSTANLFDNYTGPGPSMLSNLRFNVLSDTTVDTLFLEIRPRSRKARKDGVFIDRVRECGFVLPLVDVHDYNRTVTVHYTEEWYHPLHPPGPRSHFFEIDLLPSGPQLRPQ